MLWDPRKPRSDGAAIAATVAAAANQGQIFPTKVLRKFLTSLTSRESPVLLDLGPVVGSNVTFFGERLGCKILIEDLFAEIDRHSRKTEPPPVADMLRSRLRYEPSSIDGILCWNFFDFLDPAAAQVLGSALTKLVRPDGAVLAFFTTSAPPEGRFGKYEILDEDTLRQRPYGDSMKQRSLQNRDIIRMFEGLKVSESFLLKTNIREFLFRKPPAG